MEQTQNRWVLFFVLLFVALLVLTLGWAGQLEPLEGLLSYLTIPLQRGLGLVSADVNDFLTSARDLRELRQRNAELQRLADSLMIENVRLKETEAENQALRQLLNFTRANPWYEYKAATVAGQVVGYDPNNLLNYFIIDVGSNDGIAHNMPVITDRGLIGRISEVGPVSSKVLLVIDPSSSVNAYVQSSRATGLVRGEIGGGLVMERIAQGEELRVGDIVLTSGLGSNFPDKLVIGQITEVEQRDVALFQQARIRSTVDFSKVKVVLVITNFEPVPDIPPTPTPRTSE
jgi:rod shape-determining protein MreC